ncbi:aromatic ring-hydroxylating dioxygenase subunit alpha (plasmid) [Sphingobium sp. SJ10-10]|uniref:aromatic ring-hydroxylating oxygenase subunit alpha n=1 Tax=Sphingobium sp. SJ10-10 TaxID=3114999 RepID=UPI002E184890|nr:aromatic ring-hydroxylating dioxygenase subunit alpha [Sphingobium sp. SJ10-10]
MSPDRSVMIEAMKRLIGNVEAKTCTMADSIMELPSAYYLDEEYWKREVDRLFHKSPIVLALSCEIAEPNSYVALDNVPGFRIVVTRDGKGQPHAFYNACSHRGAPVVSGRGKAPRFSCPYHSWTYTTEGKLVGVTSERLFGECAKGEMGLTPIRVEERHGLIFGVLDPDAPFDLDDFLGDYGAELEQVGLAHMHHMWSHDFKGPNWKFCKDGFIENYHFASVHNESLPTFMGDINVTDMWGMHSRILLPDVEIHRQRTLPEEEWNPPAAFATVYYMFPNTMISTCWGDWPLITRLYPGLRPDESTAVQTLLSRNVPTPETIAEAKSWEASYKRITQEEDYVLDYGIQHAAENGHGRIYRLGRNEAALQHFHQSVARLVDPPVGLTSRASQKRMEEMA